MSDSSGFEFISSEVKVERAVAELRFGRPVVLNGGGRRLAVLALDSVSPTVYDQFAAATEGRHALFLTSHRADRLIPGTSTDIAIPLPAFPSIRRRNWLTHWVFPRLQTGMRQRR